MVLESGDRPVLTVTNDEIVNVMAPIIQYGATRRLSKREVDPRILNSNSYRIRMNVDADMLKGGSNGSASMMNSGNIDESFGTSSDRKYTRNDNDPFAARLLNRSGDDTVHVKPSGCLRLVPLTLPPALELQHHLVALKHAINREAVICVSIGVLVQVLVEVELCLAPPLLGSLHRIFLLVFPRLRGIFRRNFEQAAPDLAAPLHAVHFNDHRRPADPNMPMEALETAPSPAIDLAVELLKGLLASVNNVLRFLCIVATP